MDLFDWSATPETPDGVPLDVIDAYERFALEIIRHGFRRYSSDAILHRVRWHFHVERGRREFKCNNNWTAGLARWFMAKHPEHDGFFELRASPKSNLANDDDDGD